MEQAPVTEIPDGFKQVTKDEFFKTLYSDGRDIMPLNESPYCSTWETKSRDVFGWTAPGWSNPRGLQLYALKR